MICNFIHWIKFGSSLLQFYLKRITENQIVRACTNKSFCFIVLCWWELAKEFIALSNICLYLLFSGSLDCSVHPALPSGFRQTNIKNKTKQTTHIVNIANESAIRQQKWQVTKAKSLLNIL